MSCPYHVLILSCVLAFVSGAGFGSAFSELLLNTGMPFFALDAAKALDGDTVQITMTVHMDGVDAAELGRNRCATEQLMAERARDRAQELLNHPPVRVRLLGEDTLGRMRAEFAAGDRSVKNMLLREALVTVGDIGRWCPDDANTAPVQPVQRMMASQP